MSILKGRIICITSKQNNLKPKLHSSNLINLQVKYHLLEQRAPDLPYKNSFS